MSKHTQSDVTSLPELDVFFQPTIPRKRTVTCVVGMKAGETYAQAVERVAKFKAAYAARAAIVAATGDAA
jgi:hypothetical protein